jgi:hypothetical protein
MPNLVEVLSCGAGAHVGQPDSSYTRNVHAVSVGLMATGLLPWPPGTVEEIIMSSSLYGSAEAGHDKRVQMLLEPHIFHTTGYARSRGFCNALYASAQAGHGTCVQMLIEHVVAHAPAAPERDRGLCNAL